MENNGAFRWFCVFGAAVGMLLYQKSVSPFWVKYMSRFLCALKKFLGIAAGFLCRPFRAAKRAGTAYAKRQGKRIKRLVRICKKRLTVWIKLSKIAAGFLCRPFRAAKRAGTAYAKRQGKRIKRLVRICKKRLTVWIKLSKIFFNKRKSRRGRENGKT